MIYQFTSADYKLDRIKDGAKNVDYCKNKAVTKVRVLPYKIVKRNILKFIPVFCAGEPHKEF